MKRSLLSFFRRGGYVCEQSQQVPHLNIKTSKHQNIQTSQTLILINREIWNKWVESCNSVWNEMKWNDRNIWWYKVRPFQCQFDILTSHCPTWASLESLRSSCSRFEWIGFYGCHLWIGIPTWPITIMANHHLNMSCIVKRIKHNSILYTGRSVSILSQYLSHKYRAVLTWLGFSWLDDGFAI